ncbi:hypothetical protein [Candidatus Magnetomonas plexicatena]|uniref:hypothetical protein n=1 Tax=Candidatus Magnetomonas plexicatena TaxID=2552947 RepID=UPI001C741E3E|nr:hypothetical protein E2O03_002290 [Nitrospirales bacterium LBB_01]
MNIAKLKQAEQDFFDIYPGGFSNPIIQEIAKKHKLVQMTELACKLFDKANFENPSDIVTGMIQIVTRSSLISIFEKPKFRDFAKALPSYMQEQMANALFTLLYSDQDSGFELLVKAFKAGKLAKWSLVSVCPFYVYPQTEVFMKPTTVKGIIEFFDLKGLEYKPNPTYQFYKKYRDVINEMKQHVDPSLAPDNGHFSGFLMMTMEHKGDC